MQHCQRVRSRVQEGPHKKRNSSHFPEYGGREIQVCNAMEYQSRDHKMVQ